MVDVAVREGQSLEALVRDELRGPVAELVERVVRELVHEQLNGAAPASATEAGALPRAPQLPSAATEAAGATPDPPVTGVPPGTKTCSRCGETKPASEFSKHRAVCRVCRRRYANERNRRRRAIAKTSNGNDGEEPGLSEPPSLAD